MIVPIRQRSTNETTVLMCLRSTNRPNDRTCTPAIYRPNDRAYTPTINQPTNRQALYLTTITTAAGTVLPPKQAFAAYDLPIN
jgi:hypothetical protein